MSCARTPSSILYHNLLIVKVDKGEQKGKSDKEQMCLHGVCLNVYVYGVCVCVEGFSNLILTLSLKRCIDWSCANFALPDSHSSTLHRHL